MSALQVNLNWQVNQDFQLKSENVQITKTEKQRGRTVHFTETLSVPFQVRQVPNSAGFKITIFEHLSSSTIKTLQGKIEALHRSANIPDYAQQILSMPLTFNFSKHLQPHIDAMLADFQGSKANQQKLMQMQMLIGLTPNQQLQEVNNVARHLATAFSRLINVFRYQDANTMLEKWKNDLFSYMSECFLPDCGYQHVAFPPELPEEVTSFYGVTTPCNRKIDQLDCASYAFMELRDPALKSWIFEGRQDTAYFTNPFLQLQNGYRMVEKPDAGDLVVYFQGNEATHFAIFQESGVVRSKIGQYSGIYQHPVSQAPGTYGNRIGFFRKTNLGFN